MPLSSYLIGSIKFVLLSAIPRGDNYDDYWRGSAMETLIELARYRGLFDSEGFLSV